MNIIWTRYYQRQYTYYDSSRVSAPYYRRCGARPGDRRTNVLTEIASPTLCQLAGKKPAYRLYRSMPARTSRSGRKRELWRSENEQIISLSEVATHSPPALLEYDKTKTGVTIRLKYTKQNSDRLAWSLFHAFPRPSELNPNPVTKP